MKMDSGKYEKITSHSTLIKGNIVRRIRDNGTHKDFKLTEYDEKSERYTLESLAGLPFFLVTTTQDLIDNFEKLIS